jgi:trimethylamine---corrinoid protein Co-methyltransferase
VFKGGQLKILSDEDVENIHLASLNVLEHVGVAIHNPDAFKLLKDAGAYADEKTKVVKIPEHLVMEAVRNTPSSFTLYARNPNNNVAIEDRKVYFGPIIGRINVIDLETGKKRRTTIQDAADLTRLASALEYYKLPHSAVQMPTIEGVPDSTVHAHAYLLSQKNSDKVVKGTGRDKQRALDCIRMASVVAGCEEEELGKRPNMYTTCNTITPLQQNANQIEGLIEYAKRRIPVDIASEPQAGATSPVTLAGTLVVQNAEILSGITIAQLVNKGTPLFMGTVGTVMDLRTGIIAKGAIEAGLINVASAQIARYYNIPSRGTAGDTESKVLDIQAGFEKTITLLMAAMAGINHIWYPGCLEYALTVSYESMVMDNELCGMIYRGLEGIDCSEEMLALDLIESVGPGNHYLGQRHTLKYLQKEHHIPKLSNRQPRDIWEKQGSKELKDVAREEAKRILKEYQPTPLDKSVEEELVAIVKEIEKREAQKGQ